VTTDLPFRHDGVTMTCPVCGQTFTPNGRRRFCTDACKAVAYRRRHTQPAPVVVPATRPRRPITVYECGTCGTRALGQQRCEDCHTFMTRIGYGGLCPSCSDAVAITELLDQGGDPPHPMS
jgi:predicted nucleic acid-binding Zn ribbon protein